jgi:hypothetical protein
LPYPLTGLLGYLLYPKRSIVARWLLAGEQRKDLRLSGGQLAHVLRQLSLCFRLLISSPGQIVQAIFMRPQRLQDAGQGLLYLVKLTIGLVRVRLQIFDFSYEGIKGPALVAVKQADHFADLFGAVEDCANKIIIAVMVVLPGLPHVSHLALQASKALLCGGLLH